MADLSWEDAIIYILQHSEESLHYAEIAQRVAELNLRKRIGANPARVVATILSRSLGDPDSPFQRVARGQYTLKEQVNVHSNSDTKISEAPEDESESGALQAFGMYWKRDYVSWSGPPKLIGRQGLGASSVNFSDQVGVYLLHDRDRVIYVGRAQKESLYIRLKAHTNDRLSGRWDRFSWFGIRRLIPFAPATHHLVALRGANLHRSGADRPLRILYVSAWTSGGERFGFDRDQACRGSR